LEVLYKAFERCTSVLSHSSKPEDLAVTVCGHLTRFYAVASQFPLCREKMIEMPELVKNICRIFYYKVITTRLWDIQNYFLMR
jgi:DnaJ family protein C protein 13